MPVLVTVAWLVLSVRTFLKLCVCVFSGVSLVTIWLWHLPQVKNRMLLFTPIFPTSFLFSSSFFLNISAVSKCKSFSRYLSPLSKLKADGLLLPSHLFLSLSLILSIFISRSPLRFLTSFFYLPVVESLPNEVADGSILQRDRVERSPTLKSINLTVSISVQTSLSYESKRSILAVRVTLLCIALVLLNILPTSLSENTNPSFALLSLCCEYFKFYTSSQAKFSSLDSFFLSDTDLVISNFSFLCSCRS